jgi:hypothetical protein
MLRVSGFDAQPIRSYVGCSGPIRKHPLDQRQDTIGRRAALVGAPVRLAIITAEHAAELAAAVGLRNSIAHGYATVDVQRLWAEAPAGLESLERYSGALVALIARA